MKASPRKALMTAIQGVGVNDFATNEEMIAARTLHSMMVENSASAEAPKKRKRKKVEASESQG